MKKRYLVLALCLVLLLAGCGRQNEIQKPVYTVTFSMGEHVCSQQQVMQGHLPQSVLTNLPGLKFVQWLTEDGEPVNPYTVYVGRDIHYVAEFYPELSNHVPFLFVDEAGNIRPDDGLTGGELSQALHALASEAAVAYFPNMPAENVAVTWDVLKPILGTFFPPDAMKEMDLDTETISRSQFAQILCQLLGRGKMETISMDQSVKLPNDISREREDAVILMEASMLHTPGTREHTWDELVLPIRFEPGFLIRDGWLYYVQGNYLFLKNEEMDGFRFGADGRYTSGNARLDEVVAQILCELTQEHPNANRRALLRLAFDKCCSYELIEKGNTLSGQTDWQIEEALIMLLDEKGDCYNYAAAFWALARGLGYDARLCTGTEGQQQVPHGWVVIAFDGVDYIFDPERQHTLYWQNRYMIGFTEANQWRYQETE